MFLRRHGNGLAALWALRSESSARFVNDNLLSTPAAVERDVDSLSLYGFRSGVGILRLARRAGKAAEPAKPRSPAGLGPAGEPDQPHFGKSFCRTCQRGRFCYT